MKFGLLKLKYIYRLMQFGKLYKRFSEYTMIPEDEYIRNLFLAKKAETVEGVIVECGVWRGGMIGGIAKLLGPQKKYYLFDSFDGLPLAKDIDGEEAFKWQSEKESSYYFDNCKAEIDFAQKVMNLALGKISNNTFFIKGWFNETMNEDNFNESISLLRLDGDWYESTMTCLNFLFPKVVTGGIIIIDDYHTWEGCTKAIHDYLSKNNRPERICQFENRTAYLIKR